MQVREISYEAEFYPRFVKEVEMFAEMIERYSSR